VSASWGNMLGAVLGNSLAFNAVALGLALAVPMLLLGFIRQTIRVRRQRSDFSLGRLEALELGRTILVYGKVRNSLREIEQLAQNANASLWERHRLRTEVNRRYGVERSDLQAYARHLRANILRLRSLPFERFKSWVHSVSARFAFGCSLAVYALATMILLAICYLEQSARPQEIWSNLTELLLWKVADPLLYANSISAIACLVTFPIFYCSDRARLRSLHRREMRTLKDFAAVDPDLLIVSADGWSEKDSGETADDQARCGSADGELERFEAPHDEPWHVVLGVSPSATADEIRRAYRAQIKQNHPDRVHGMSSVFRELAEQQTKKLNSAYEEALSSLQGFDNKPAQRAGSIFT